MELALILGDTPCNTCNIGLETLYCKGLLQPICSLGGFFPRANVKLFTRGRT